jgi:hypothetical protein
MCAAQPALLVLTLTFCDLMLLSMIARMKRRAIKPDAEENFVFSWHYDDTFLDD